MITKQAYAKINLTLDIKGKRDDGYHLIETVMQSVTLADNISAEKADSIVISCSDSSVPIDNRNTCYKAAERFFEYTGITGGAEITIDKHIPTEAGLGGGSSDAATLLCILNELYDAKLSWYDLETIASKVGADVPFCVQGGTAICRGVGEKIERISGLEKRYVMLVKPNFGVSTPEAYQKFDQQKLTSACGTAAFLEAMKSGRNPYYKVSNDLETAIADIEIAKLRRELLETGAEAAQMTGSGSCVFGLFLTVYAAERAKKIIHGKYPFIKICETII